MCGLATVVSEGRPKLTVPWFLSTEEDYEAGTLQSMIELVFISSHQVNASSWASQMGLLEL